MTEVKNLEFDLLNSPIEDREYDWSKPSKAVVYNGEEFSSILSTAGPHVRSFMDEVGLSLNASLKDVGLDEGAELGLSIWEGLIKTAHIHTVDCNEYDSWLAGTFRKPTEEEMRDIIAGKCPWDEAEWLVKRNPEVEGKCWDK